MMQLLLSLVFPTHGPLVLIAVDPVWFSVYANEQISQGPVCCGMRSTSIPQQEAPQCLVQRLLPIITDCHGSLESLNKMFDLAI